jgi:predicted transcriptional regulator
MWYEVKELSSNPGNSDSKIAKKLGVDRRTVSRYKKCKQESKIQ